MKAHKCPTCGATYSIEVKTRGWGDGIKIQPISRQDMIDRGYLDDNGNPPPAGMQGDMIPQWKHGQWWVCHYSLVQYEKGLEAND